MAKTRRMLERFSATSRERSISRAKYLDFQTLNSVCPDADARWHGTYNIVNHRINLHGDMKVETKISKTSSGAKSLLLKIMDPRFRKKKKGEVMPVHILGTYEKPEFALDLANAGKEENTK